MARILFTLVAAIIGAAALAAASATPGVAADIDVTLTGVEARGGVLYVSLQTEADYKQPRATRGEMFETPAAGDLTFSWTDVPAGDYALSVLHDEDGDQQMKREQNGWPLEGWAITNGDDLRGPPTFADVKVTVNDDGFVIVEAMHYPAD